MFYINNKIHSILFLYKILPKARLFKVLKIYQNILNAGLKKVILFKLFI